MPLSSKEVSNQQSSSLPQTQGIKYAGSKLKILPHILEIIQTTPAERVFDGFSGTTRVSQALAKKGFEVHSNDLSEWSQHFATAYLKNRDTPQNYDDLIKHLNNQKPIDGWFSENYGGDPKQQKNQPSGKKPWQIHNTRKLDAIRTEIENLKLSSIERSVALASLILALDEVDNTLGHHSSYLREWAKRSYKNLNLKVPNLWINEQDHIVSKSDVFKVITETDAQLAYFDPPYGSNNEKMPPSRVRYAGYYHLWTSVCKNDQPSIFGKAGRRSDSSDTLAYSPFEDFRKNEAGQFLAVESIEKLLKVTPCEWILLSYSSGGRATAEQLHEAISTHGKLVKNIEIEYRKHVMAAMQSTKDWLQDNNQQNKEFLLLIQKS